MTFTSAQAAKALCVTPATMRKHRERKGIGSVARPGRTEWSMEELEQLRRDQGRYKARYVIRFTVEQLRGNPIVGSFSIWADSQRLAESKAHAWFWGAELKAHPEKWGIPVRFLIDKVEMAL